MTNQDAVDFVRERLNQGVAPTDVACQLLDACLASDPKEARGVGCDNMTAIVVSLRGEAFAGRSGSGDAPAVGMASASAGGRSGAADEAAAE
jgi:serine/threonine protein phosphatase PrpC